MLTGPGRMVDVAIKVKVGWRPYTLDDDIV
jgi:hypothetical protein